MEKDIRRCVREKEKALRFSDAKNRSIAADRCQTLGLYFKDIPRQRPRAIEEFKMARDICEELGDKLGCANAARSAGEVYSLMSDFENALRYQEEYLELARQLNDQRTIEVQRACTMVAQVHIDHVEMLMELKQEHRPEIPLILAQAKKALEDSMEAIEVLRDEGSVAEKELATMECRAHINMGIVCMNTKGKMQQAEDSFQRAKRIADEYMLTDDRIRVLQNLVELNFRRECYDVALHFVDELDTGGEVKASTVDTFVVWKPRLLLYDEKYEEARRALARVGFSVAQSTKKVFDKNFKDELAKKLVRIDRIYTNVETLKPTGLSPVEEAEICEKIADDLCEFKAYTPAAKFYMLAIEAKESAGMRKRELAPLYQSLAQTNNDLGELDSSVINYLNEVSCYDTDDAKDWMLKADSYFAMAKVRQRAGHACHRVEAEFENAFEAAKRSGDAGRQREILDAHAAFLEERGLTEEAELKRNTEVEGVEFTQDSEEQAADYELETSLREALERFPAEWSAYVEPVKKKGREAVYWMGLPLKRNAAGETELHTAVISGDVDQVKKLLGKRFPLDVTDYNNWTPLHEAAHHGHHAIVELLLDAGADINVAGGNDEEATPLMEAAAGAHRETVQVLLDRGADPLMRNREGHTAWECFWMFNRGGSEGDPIPIALESAMRRAGCDRMPRRPEAVSAAVPETGSQSRAAAVAGRSRSKRKASGRRSPISDYQRAIARVGRSATGAAGREERNATEYGTTNREEADEADDDYFRGATRNQRVAAAEDSSDSDGFIVDDVEPPAAKRKKHSDESSSSSFRPLARRPRRQPFSSSTQVSVTPPMFQKSVATTTSTSFRSSSPAFRSQLPARSFGGPAPTSAPSFQLSPVRRGGERTRPVSLIPSSADAISSGLESVALETAPPPRPSVVSSPFVASVLHEARPANANFVTVAFRDKLLPVGLNPRETAREFLEKATKVHEETYGCKPIVSSLIGTNGMTLPMDQPMETFVKGGDKIVAEITRVDVAFDIKVKFGVDASEEQVTEGTLDLHGRALQPVAVTQIRDVIGNFSFLTSLQLKNNFLGDQIVSVFGQGAEQFSSLKFLDLSCNGITHFGLRELGRHLSARADEGLLRSLEELNLSSNILTDSAADGLASIFERCTRLRYFHCRCSDLTPGLFKNAALRENLRRSECFQLDLSDNALLCDELFESLNPDRVGILTLARIARSGMNVGILTRGLRKFLERATHIKSVSLVATACRTRR